MIASDQIGTIVQIGEWVIHVAMGGLALHVMVLIPTSLNCMLTYHIYATQQISTYEQTKVNYSS